MGKRQNGSEERERTGRGEEGRLGEEARKCVRNIWSRQMCALVCKGGDGAKCEQECQLGVRAEEGLGVRASPKRLVLYMRGSDADPRRFPTRFAL